MPKRYNPIAQDEVMYWFDILQDNSINNICSITGIRRDKIRKIIHKKYNRKHKMEKKFNHRRIKLIPGMEDKIEEFRKKRVVDRDGGANSMYSKKLEFAVKLSFRNVAEAIGDLGQRAFEDQFAKKYL